MSSSQDIADQIEDLTADLARMKAEIAKKFIGQKLVIDLSLTALLSGGHGLLVGVPGPGGQRFGLLPPHLAQPGQAGRPVPKHPSF